MSVLDDTWVCSTVENFEATDDRDEIRGDCEIKTRPTG